MLFRSQKIKQHKSIEVLSSAIFYHNCHDVTSDTCHGSTISSVDCLWKINHAKKLANFIDRLTSALE